MKTIVLFCLLFLAICTHAQLDSAGHQNIKRLKGLVDSPIEAPLDFNFRMASAIEQKKASMLIQPLRMTLSRQDIEMINFYDNHTDYVPPFDYGKTSKYPRVMTQDYAYPAFINSIVDPYLVGPLECATETIKP